MGLELPPHQTDRGAGSKVRQEAEWNGVLVAGLFLVGLADVVTLFCERRRGLGRLAGKLLQTT